MYLYVGPGINYPLLTRLLTIVAILKMPFRNHFAIQFLLNNIISSHSCQVSISIRWNFTILLFYQAPEKTIEKLCEKCGVSSMKTIHWTFKKIQGFVYLLAIVCCHQTDNDNCHWNNTWSSLRQQQQQQNIQASKFKPFLVQMCKSKSAGSNQINGNHPILCLSDNQMQLMLLLLLSSSDVIIMWCYYQVIQVIM